VRHAISLALPPTRDPAEGEVGGHGDRFAVAVVLDFSPVTILIVADYT
jgi:hypothetical protein